MSSAPSFPPPPPPLVVVPTTTFSHEALPLLWEFFDISCVILYVSSIGVVYYSSFRAIEVERLLQSNTQLAGLVITDKMALMYPVLASVVLIIFFYFFSVMSFLMMCSLLVTATTALILSIYPTIRALYPKSEKITLRISGIGETTLIQLISGFFSVFILFSWLITGHSLLNNVIGLSFCVMSISVLRIPNVKVACIALVCLFFYDIFWVFYSEYFFGENVMLKVATTAADNPINPLASTFGLDVVKKIHLPIKVIWGNRLLGLGDIVLPGIVVAFSLKVDKMWIKQSSYFNSVFIGYCIGLFCAMIGAFVFRIAQPALLYIVPATLLPFLYLGWKRKELDLLWRGSSAGGGAGSSGGVGSSGGGAEGYFSNNFSKDVFLLPQ